MSRAASAKRAADSHRLGPILIATEGLYIPMAG